MPKYKKRLGKIGEDYAVKYLKGKGFEILDRNVFVGRGEIDIIVKKGNIIVFVEVKTRRSDKFVDILDSLDGSKEESLVTSCERYLAKAGLEDVDYRIDLIGIVIREGLVEKFEHIEGVV